MLASRVPVLASPTSNQHAAVTRHHNRKTEAGNGLIIPLRPENPGSGIANPPQWTPPQLEVAAPGAAFPCVLSVVAGVRRLAM